MNEEDKVTMVTSGNGQYMGWRKLDSSSHNYCLMISGRIGMDCSRDNGR